MIKILIILSLLLNKIFDGIIEYLNSVHLKSELPDNVKDVYDAAEYKKWISYEKEYGKVHLVEGILETALAVVLLASNVYAWLFDLFSRFPIYGQYAVVIVIIIAASTVLGIPFDYYKTFVLEEKYGMNKTTHKTFVLDILKELLIGAVLAYLLMALIMFLFERYGNMAILWTTIALAAFSLLIAALTIPFMRIFNKFTPLEDGELKERLTVLCDRYGVGIKKIVVRDASRRTIKSNAFCTGFAKKKTISLDDNLVNNFTPGEITAVFAHEFAHARYHHILKSIPFALFRQTLTVAVIGLILNVPALFGAFGFDSINYFFATILMSPLIWPLQTGLDAISNYLSRRHEYEADAFAATEGYGPELIAALKRLCEESLADINPHPLKVKLGYSHPTLSQRIQAITAAGATEATGAAEAAGTAEVAGAGFASSHADHC